MKDALLANPPDMVILLKVYGEHEPAFTEELEGILAETGIYERLKPDVEPIRDKTDHMDWTGFEFYKLNSGLKETSEPAPGQPAARERTNG